MGVVVISRRLDLSLGATMVAGAATFGILIDGGLPGFAALGLAVLAWGPSFARADDVDQQIVARAPQRRLDEARPGAADDVGPFERRQAPEFRAAAERRQTALEVETQALGAAEQVAIHPVGAQRRAVDIGEQRRRPDRVAGRRRARCSARQVCRRCTTAPAGAVRAGAAFQLGA